MAMLFAKSIYFTVFLESYNLRRAYAVCIDLGSNYTVGDSGFVVYVSGRLSQEYFRTLGSQTCIHRSKEKTRPFSHG